MSDETKASELKPAPQGTDKIHDMKLFADYVKRENPGLGALIGNAFRLTEQAGVLNFYFDRQNANLIPMVKSVMNYKPLMNLVEQVFGKAYDLNFAIGADPKLAKQRQQDAEALDIVRQDPRVQFLMDKYQGSIIRCEPLAERSDDDV